MEKSQIPKIILNSDELGILLGITGRRVRQLCELNILPKTKRAQYDLIPCAKAYILYLEDVHTNRPQKHSELKRQYVEEKIKLTRAKAAQCELEVEAMKADLIPVSDIENAWSTISSHIKSYFVAIPVDIAPVLLSMKTTSEVQTCLQNVIYQVLSNISNTKIEYIDRY